MNSRKDIHKSSFWGDGISIDESRFSLIAALLWVGSGFAFYQIIAQGDISVGLLTFLGYLIAAIAGVNITDSIVNRKSNSNYSSQPQDVSNKDDYSA